MNTEYQPEIFVLIGLPGSGKSTWIEMHFGNTSNYMVISSDNHVERLCKADGITYREGFDKHVKEATNCLKNDLKYAIDNNMSIIWDQTNMAAKKREGILKDIPSHYKKIAVEFSVDDVELQRRLQDREEKTGKYIPDHVIKSMKGSYQPATRKEGFDMIIKG